MGDSYNSTATEKTFSCFKNEFVHHKHNKTIHNFAYIETHYYAIRPSSGINWIWLTILRGVSEAFIPRKPLCNEQERMIDFSCQDVFLCVTVPKIRLSETHCQINYGKNAIYRSFSYILLIHHISSPLVLGKSIVLSVFIDWMEIIDLH